MRLRSLCCIGSIEITGKYYDDNDDVAFISIFTHQRVGRQTYKHN